MSQDSPLLNEFKLHDLTLKNRVVLAPMTRGRAGKQRTANRLMAEYYTQRAGGGLLISEATVISEQANGWVNSPGIYTDGMVEGWKLVTSAVHDAGAPIFLQMWHCGRASHSAFHDGKLAVAPSAIAIDEEYIHTPDGKLPHETPRALETDEIPGVVNDYKVAAERAKAAGFDGVEVHAANGYLIDTFLQSKTNQRTDHYGGSLENRFRFLKEVLIAVTSVFPPHRVGVRFSPNGMYNDMGSPDYREAYTYYASEVNKFGLAYLHVMDGLAFGFHELGEPMTLPEFRKVFDGPIIGNCGYDQASGEAAIRDGHADLIAYGRPYITNPDLVARFKNDWPLAEDADPKLWSVDGARGYTDFPAYK